MISVPDTEVAEALDEHFEGSVLGEGSCHGPDCDDGPHDLYVAFDDTEDPEAAAEAVDGVEFVHVVEVPSMPSDLAKFDYTG